VNRGEFDFYTDVVKCGHMNMHSESPEARRGQTVEYKDRPAFELTVVMHRHGPKEGQNGPLKESGKEEVETSFDDAYEGVALDDEATGGVDIVYSPIDRTRQTGAIAAAGIRRRGGVVKSIGPDDRLNEGEISRYEDQLKEKLGGGKGRWLNGWMQLENRPMPDVKTGKESAADVADWLLELIQNKKKAGGAQEVEAFSHYPVMAGFLMRLEEVSGKKILPDNWMEPSPAWSHLDFLSSFAVHTDARMNNRFMIAFSGNRVELPVSVLEDMVASAREESAAAK
jgi:broad specificity phosphatase PhoE